MKDLFQKYGIALNDCQIGQFERYYELLTEYNKKFNITSILDKDEVIVKHFLDSAIAETMEILMADMIVTAILIIVLGLAIYLTVKKRKTGSGCCGCFYERNCSGNCKNRKQNQK